MHANRASDSPVQGYMLGIDDEQISSASQALLDAGFVREEWSWSCRKDPARRKNDEVYQQMHRELAQSYTRFNAQTARFRYDDEARYVEQTVLVPSSYIHLWAPSVAAPAIQRGLANPPYSSQPRFYQHNNLYYPNVAILLQSLIRVILDERAWTNRYDWRLKLETWAFDCLYEGLSLREDILDTCEDEEVKEFLNSEVDRGSGSSRIRMKWGKPLPKITNAMIEQFQIEYNI